MGVLGGWRFSYERSTLVHQPNGQSKTLRLRLLGAEQKRSLRAPPLGPYRRPFGRSLLQGYLAHKKPPRTRFGRSPSVPPGGTLGGTCFYVYRGTSLIRKRHPLGIL